MPAQDREVGWDYGEVDYTDFAHTGPGTLAGRYLRTFWQPVYVARHLPRGQARPLRILSEELTLYRGEGGGAHLLDSRCAHRGTQLSTGWVEDDCLRCFYHGWKYDGAGQCVEQPAEDASFAAKVRIRAYPTREYLGLIFAYLGPGDPPSLPRFPEAEEEGVLVATTFNQLCNYFQDLENGVDEVHLAFAHRKSRFTEYGLNWDLPRISAEETDYGLIQYGTRSNGVVRATHYHMPNPLHYTGSPYDADSGWRDVLTWRVPIDDTCHASFNVNLVHVSGEAAGRFAERMERKLAEHATLPPPETVAAAVLAGEASLEGLEDRMDFVTIQDHIAQTAQGVIADRTHERLGRSDVAIILLRKLWERELRALAEGRPLKQWTRPARLSATVGM